MNQTKPRVSVIAALAKNRVIGIENRLPWRLPEDLAHFKALTLGHPILMGRKTFESLGRPLPGRTNIVITRNLDYCKDGCLVADSIPAALALCAEVDEVFFIGGAELYAQVIPLADRLYLTEVDIDAQGDAWFPEYDKSAFREVSREPHTGEKGDVLGFDFVVYERVPLIAMPSDNRYTEALEAHLKQWKEMAERIRTQMEPLRDIHESIRKSIQPVIDTRETLQKALEPIFVNQERWRQIVESVRLPQIVFPDISPIAKQVIDFQKAIQASIGPAFLKLKKGFKELPARTQEALLLLGRHGWYLDPEMSLPALWELKSALSEGNIVEAAAALVEYFESRVAEIEESITSKFPHRSHLIRSAFDAHRREEYALSIPVLLAQSDGICKETVDQYLFIRQDKKPRTAIYVDQIAADTYMAALLSPLAETLPIGAPANERPDGFSALNRHMVLHGESLDYGSKTNGLKAISLVNYVAHVLPGGNL